MASEGYGISAAVWNRESILELLAREFDRAAHEARQLSILLIGIDELPQDRIPSTELVLEVAKRITGCIRSYDHVGRYAAEQLLVLPLSYDAGEISSLAQSLCDAVARDAIQIGGEPTFVTISVSVAVVTDFRTNHQQVLRQLETALHRAQAAGGNRVAMTAFGHSVPNTVKSGTDGFPLRPAIIGAVLVCLVALLTVNPSWSCLPFRLADIFSSEELPPPLPTECSPTSQAPSTMMLQSIDKQREAGGLLLQETITCKLPVSGRSRAARTRDEQWLSTLYVNGAYQYRRHVFLAASEDVPGGRLYTVQICLLPWWTYLKQSGDACWGQYAFWK